MELALKQIPPMDCYIF